MKRRFTILTAALALLTFLAVPMGMWGQTRAEVVAYTLEPAAGSNSNYASNCDITIDGITWNLTGNSQMIPWRIGGKSLSNVDRTLYSKTAISDNISKIEVTHGAASSITVNSWTVIVASNASFSNVVSTLTPTFAANQTTTIERPTGADWSNCYFKFVYNVSVSGSSNKFIQFSEAKFYKEESSSLLPSDLAITGDPVALSFDLFNNASAQTVSYTTSSTGAVTVSQSEYVNTNVSGNTITVTPVRVTPSAQTITVSQTADATYAAGSATFTVTVANSTPQYTVTYHANVTGTADIVETYYEGDDVTVAAANTFSNPGYDFIEWNTEEDGSGDNYAPEDVINDIDDDIDLYAQWEVSTSTTGLINFGKTDGYVQITSASVTGNDNLDNTWTITTQGTTFFSASYSYNQIGSSNSPASSITFTTTLPEEVNVTAMEAKFGGFSGTAGTITLKVGNTTIGTGSLDAGNDVTVNSTSTETGNVLTVTITNISKGVKAYYISYTYEAATPSTNPSITVTPATANPSATDVEGTLAISYANLTISDMTDFDVEFYDSEGHALASGNEPDWIEVLIAEENNEYLVSYTMDANQGAARTAYFKVFAMGDEDFVYSNLVTVTQAAYEYPNYTWDLSTNSYVSASETEVSWTSSFATMVIDKDQSSTAANNYLGGTNNRTSTRFYTNSILTLSPVSGYVITSVVFTATTTGYASALGNSTWTNATASVDGMVVTVTPTDGSIDMSATIGGTCGFTQVKVYYSFLLTITGYSGEKDHYYLIASPVTVDPATAGMTTGDYDLYYFDQEQADEWRHYDQGSFNLVPGTGYLYAKKAANGNSTYSFELTGIPYAGNGTVHLVYNENAEFPGFNLIGNPFGTNANLDLPFYRLNQEGSALKTSTETDQISVMEGVFVQATAATRTANFTQATGAKRISQLNVKVTRNRSAVLDNAIIRFDDGATLGKFQLNQDDTKVYFTEGNQDFAVVRSNNAGEMPVSFKAAENGNYTLSVEAENVEASYLHLIDNMTGADVDLLATPSYSFEARTTDYANRFRLVFNANGVDENNATASFAYFNGSSWTISNMGEATLQVVDMMGRVVSTQAISGNTDINLNQVPGVYMLRLVNGENVMVQKVVVR